MILENFIDDIVRPFDPNSLTDVLLDSGDRGLRPVDTIDGRSLISSVGRVFTTSGTVTVDQSLTRRTNPDHPARAAFRFGSGFDAVESPDTTLGDITGTKNWAVAIGFSVPAGAGFGSIAGKFDGDGWQILMDSNGRLNIQLETTSGSATPDSQLIYNDNGRYIILLHVVVTSGSERVVLASERERIEVAWPGGSASTTTPLRLGAVQAPTNGMDLSWAAFFIDTPPTLDEQGLVISWHAGKNSQGLTGNGWTQSPTAARYST